MVKCRIVFSSFLWLLCTDAFSQLTRPGGISGNKKYKVEFLSLGYLDSKSVSLPRVNFYLGAKKKEKPDYTLSDKGFADKEGKVLCASEKVDRIDQDLKNRKREIVKLKSPFCPVFEDLIFVNDFNKYIGYSIFFNQFDEKTKSGVVSFKNQQYFIELPKDAEFEIDSYFSTNPMSDYKEAYVLFNNVTLEYRRESLSFTPLYNAILAYEKGDKSGLDSLVVLTDSAEGDRKTAIKKKKKCFRCDAQLLQIRFNNSKESFRVVGDDLYKVKKLDTILKIIKKQIELIREYDFFEHDSYREVSIHDSLTMHPLYQDDLIRKMKLGLYGHLGYEKYDSYFAVDIDVKEGLDPKDMLNKEI